MANREISYQKVPGLDDKFYYRDDTAREQLAGLGTYATKSGAAVVITADDTTPPSDTSVLWCYPES